MEIALASNNIAKTYGYGTKAVHALRGVSLSVAPGKIYGAPTCRRRIEATRVAAGSMINCQKKKDKPAMPVMQQDWASI